MSQSQASDYGECTICKGTGWELYKATIFDYGFESEIEMARKCPRCTGVWRTADKTGVPDEYREADLYKFNFEAYNEEMKALAEKYEGQLALYRYAIGKVFGAENVETELIHLYR